MGCSFHGCYVLALTLLRDHSTLLPRSSSSRQQIQHDINLCTLFSCCIGRSRIACFGGYNTLLCGWDLLRSCFGSFAAASPKAEHHDKESSFCSLRVDLHSKRTRDSRTELQHSRQLSLPRTHTSLSQATSSLHHHSCAGSSSTTSFPIYKLHTRPTCRRNEKQRIS